MDNQATRIISIFDYDNCEKKCEIPNKPIKRLSVSVLSGDETVLIRFDDDTSIEFDASECRCFDYYDGSYSLENENEIEKWIHYKNFGNSNTVSYDRLLEFM